MMIHFIRPSWLLLLLPAVLYLAWVVYSYQHNNPWKKICDPHLLPALLQSNPYKSKIFFNISLFLFFIVSIFALAGPAWNKTKLPVYRDINSLMIVLDLSPNMQLTDLKPDRLTRAKLKIRDLINLAQNTQAGLVVFTQEAFVVSPLSQDANTLNTMLDELNPGMMPIAGSDIAQGLTNGLSLLKQAASSHSNLLLITASDPSANSEAIAKNIAQAGHHLNVLAMLEANGNTQSTIAKLQQLAKTGNGSFYLFSPDASDIQQILHNNQTKQSVKDEDAENAFLWQDAGPWFCLLLIPFALVVLREKMK